MVKIRLLARLGAKPEREIAFAEGGLPARGTF